MSGRVDVDALKARVDLVALVARDTKLKRRGQEYWGCCPLPNHSERTASFHVIPTKGLFKCFGCGAGGDAIAYLERTRGLSFVAAVEQLAQFAGIYPGEMSRPDPIVEQRRREAEARKDAAERRELSSKIDTAARIWRECRSPQGTPVEAYLRARGITGPLPASLRYHPYLRHKPSGLSFPAMVGVMQVGRHFSGVHRTYLTADGSDKIASSSAKMMLGRAGGAAVRLAPPGSHLYLAEGIETALSVRDSLNAGAVVWAGLSLGNLAQVVLPQEILCVTLCADNDQSDWRSARNAVQAAADAIGASGRDVRVAWPPRGMDFNDLLGKGAA
ncbi:DNA primase [Rhodoligotrophos appendicifer]|uniref:DUF7146 domain-containing protein n=1 Tax=Rhodoligotrophos appendicifer TaxID=987056 RepID=UPI00118665DC|nr:CHC2 zinc finger domain-containing protein [Rhodoligotrophos appendicifer]